MDCAFSELRALGEVSAFGAGVGEGGGLSSFTILEETVRVFYVCLKFEIEGEDFASVLMCVWE